jgi:hypothetical protein
VKRTYLNTELFALLLGCPLWAVSSLVQCVIYITVLIIVLPPFSHSFLLLSYIKESYLFVKMQVECIIYCI